MDSQREIRSYSNGAQCSRGSIIGTSVAGHERWIRGNCSSTAARRGLTLDQLAARSQISRGQISNLEHGRRRARADTAAALDRALGAGGLLIWLAAEGTEDDGVRRRAILAAVSAAAGAGALDGTYTLADLLRHGLLGVAGAAEDWEAATAVYTAQLVTDPSPAYGTALLAALAVLRNQPPTADRIRAGARIGQLYGLWLGNQGQLGAAHHWYRSATALADRSGCLDTRAYTRGRAAARGLYEGWTVTRTLDTAATALALTARPTSGGVEAHAARVQVHALTGDLRAGRRAVAAMADLAGRLDGHGGGARTAFLSASWNAAPAANRTPCALATSPSPSWPTGRPGWPRSSSTAAGHWPLPAGCTKG
ncbi:hypothetical protein GCM10010123_22670 [Pilimelia anulata]|uniref:HTH cro/C1-type domain-containing protein n=1 Tax=Pilimelia anulata TaxID=53371 RepID=A0A8J3FAH3_9ACTN|nr:helix-turn-helix transcriptional regulator [Pilimelia anulata]GGJ92309.1 hypothetical protein GCM10010123_22670 [Pilimelia anulata]